MSKTLEEIALQVAEGMPDGFLWTEGCGWEAGIIQSEAIDFARRLVAALGAQEPVAWVTGGDCYENGHIDCVAWATGEFTTPLYAAPYIKEGWQMVPKSQYAELIQCCEDMATGKGGWAWEDILDEHRAILTAPEYGK